MHHMRGNDIVFGNVCTIIEGIAYKGTLHTIEESAPYKQELHNIGKRVHHMRICAQHESE